MKNKKLSIIITNYNTFHFVEFLLNRIAKLTKSNLQVYVHDNGSKKKEIGLLQNLCLKYHKLNIKIILDVNNSETSFAHAKALDDTIKLIDTKYCCVFDSDCVPIAKNWDELMINKLEEGYSIVGSPFYNSPNAQTVKYTDFPAPFIVMFNVEDYRLSVTSAKAENTSTRDTSMKWRNDFIKNKLKFKVFDQYHTRDRYIKNFDSVECVCYFFNSILIASHLGRGSSKRKHTYFKRNFFYRLPLISDILRLFLFKIDFQRWKRACENN